MGCGEPALAGKTGKVETAWISVSLAAAVELALLNGVHRLTKSRLPVPRAGDPVNFKTYGEFKDAVKTHLAYLIKRGVEEGQMLDLLQEQRPVLVTSLSFEDCIENGKDIMSGGAKNNVGSTAFIFIGTADIFNSLASVKRLIYEDKKLTWDELLEALGNDFEGHEEIRQMCLSAPKYGNDIPEVDEIATETTQFAVEEVWKYKGRYGGDRLIILSAKGGSHNTPGHYVGALPSGRKAWLPLADAVSPMPGTDRKGATAVLRSVSKCRHDLFTGGTLLNMKLDPSLIKDERGMGDFVSLLKSAYDLDLFAIQFNVVSAETLREAQRHPEQYRDLMVRVSGYSVFFVELYKDFQDDIIARTTVGTLA